MRRIARRRCDPPVPAAPSWATMTFAQLPLTVPRTWWRGAHEVLRRQQALLWRSCHPTARATMRAKALSLSPWLQLRLSQGFTSSRSRDGLSLMFLQVCKVVPRRTCRLLCVPLGGGGQ